MSKNYTQSTASLKTTVHDTFILDAQKVMIYPGSGDKTSRVNIIDTIKGTESKISNVSLVVSDISSTLNGVVNDVAALETVVDSLGGTYVAKTDYNSFVSSTNSSISTINTTLENCAKTNVTNTFTAANTFNGTATIKGTATFNSTITKSTTSSEPDSLESTQVLNKAENNKLYPQLAIDNTLTGSNTFKKTIDADGGLESQGDVIVKDGNIIVDKNASITFVDEGEIQITKVASGYIYQTGIPSELDNGKVFDLGVIDSDKDLSSIAFCGDDTIIQTCEIWFHMGETVYSITWPSNTWWIDSSTGVSPTWAANMRYRIAFRKEIDTIVASLSYSYTKTV